ncbi:hypothetical protein TNCV_5035331 [Trichonephila clavipes]|nr:hypothetical protein TNCV_5035331 [Trichonephila clavipes]
MVRITDSCVMSSCLVPLKDHRQVGRYTLNLSRLKRRLANVVWKLEERLPHQMSSLSLNHGSKLRFPLPKAVV